MQEYERFGVHFDPDTLVASVDRDQSMQAVAAHLSSTFGFVTHDLSVLSLNQDLAYTYFRQVMAARSVSPEETEEILAQHIRGNPAASSVYIGDIREAIGAPVDYLIFMSNRSNLHFPTDLGEEIAHGEHVTMLCESGMTYAEYKQRFHVITEEFIGYAGRQEIHKQLGRRFRHEPVLDASQSIGETSLGHDIAYLAFDDMLDRGVSLPLRDLFHAKDQTTFWQIVQGVTDEPVQMDFVFPRNVIFDRFEAATRRMVRTAQADGAISVSFAYEE